MVDKDKKLFPQRLWELVNDEKYNFCLRWSPDGQRIYLNRGEFETHYLRTPDNQFHTQKAISFVRQMNMYGFRKVDDCYYENDNFKRNCHDLLKYMIRRHSNRNNPGTLNEINQQNTSRMDPYYVNINHWNNSAPHDNLPRGVACPDNTPLASACGYSLEGRQSEGQINNRRHNNSLLSSSIVDNSKDSDSDVDIGGSDIDFSSNPNIVSDAQEQNQNQMASIQSMIQQFIACPNQVTPRNSFDQRRLSEQNDTIRHNLTLASQNNAAIACSTGNLNQNSVAGLNTSGISQSTLASTLLYEQLAELNFGSAHGDLFQEQSRQYQHPNEIQHQQRHQHRQQQQQQHCSQQTQAKRRRRARSDVSLDGASMTQTLEQQAECSTPQTQAANTTQDVSPPLQSSGVPRNQSMPSSLNEQQSLAFHQAVLEQTLFRSLLQHQQHTLNASLQQNILQNLRQKTPIVPFNPLLPSTSCQLSRAVVAASTSSTTSNPSQAANHLPGVIVRPLELTINSSASSSNSDHESSFARRMSLESHLCRVRNDGHNLASTPNSNMSGPSRLNSPRPKRGVEALDEDEVCHSPCQDDGPFIRTRSGSHKRSSSSASPCSGLTPQSRRLEDLQDFDDDDDDDDNSNDVILDLAKPKSPTTNEKENKTDETKE